MTDQLAAAAGPLAGLLAGMAFGWVYFTLLWHGTSRFTRSAGQGGHGAEWLVLGFVLRLGLTAGALGLAVLAGAGAPEMLAAALGFTLARQLAVRRLREG
jgi:F1F0 ATPase subunit 2